MNLLREVAKALFEDPSATDVEIAAKIFGESGVKNGRLTVPERNTEAVQKALRELTSIKKDADE